MYTKIKKQDVTNAYETINKITKGLLSLYKVSYKASKDAPNTHSKMLKSYAEKGYFVVYNGGDHGLLGEEGNIAFRALHDYMHVHHELTFSFQDEKSLSNIAKIEYMHYAYTVLGLTQWETYVIGRVIDREIRGQIEYYQENGKFIEDQASFVLTQLVS